MRRRPLLLLLLVALLTLGSGTVAAKPYVTTGALHQTHVIEHLYAFQHCRPELGLYTHTSDSQVRWHVTAAGVDDSDGEPGDPIPPYHLTYVTTGTVELVPETAGQPSFTGHFAYRQVEHDLGAGEVVTGTGRETLHGSDGSKVTRWVVYHLTITPQGEVAVNFAESDQCSIS